MQNENFEKNKIIQWQENKTAYISNRFRRKFQQIPTWMAACPAIQLDLQLQWFYRASGSDERDELRGSWTTTNPNKYAQLTLP